MGWKIWTGKYDQEVRHLRGLVDEIMVICGEYGDRNDTIIDWSKTTLREEILRAIEETQGEYEEAKKND